MIVLEIIQGLTQSHYLKNETDHLPPSIFYQLIKSVECDIAQGMVFREKRSRRIQKLTMDVDPGYKYSRKNRGEVQWYMMGSKDFIWSISFKLKNENNHLVSFNDQSVILWSSIKLNGINFKVNF